MALITRSITAEDLFSAGISTVIGAVLMGVSVWAHQLGAHERAHWIETQGIVVDSVSRRLRSDDQTMYAPVIEFQANGDRAQLIGSYETYRLSTGEKVVIHFNPQHPDQQARVVEPFDSLAPWASFGLGGAALTFGLSKLLPWRWS